MKGAPAMDADAFTDRFLAIEERLALFQDRSIGYPWWDAVRYDVYRMAYAQVAGVPTASPHRPPLGRRCVGVARRTFKRLALHGAALGRRHDVLVLRAPRQMREGQPTDPALDGLVPHLQGRCLVVDTFPDYYHLPRPQPQRMPARHPAVLARLAQALQAELGVRSDAAALQALVAQRLQAFEWALGAYRKLLARVKPRLVLLVQNGLEKALFQAAHEAGIAVVEAQHGLIGHAHPAYSYPRSLRPGSLQTLPDLFLTFSEYWSRACHYPAGHCEAVGNDRFYVRPLPLPPPGAGAVMAISADIYHAVLSRWLRPAAAALPARRFIYKLHPNQHTGFAAIRDEFRDLPNVEVVDSSVAAPSLLPAVSHVVVVQSTVLQEALQAGRQVCVLPELNYRMHEADFHRPQVTVAADVQALIAALQAGVVQAERPVFFDPFNAARARELLGQCLRKKRGGGLAAASRP